MATAINPVQQREFVCPSEANAERPTTFKIATLTGTQFLDVIADYKIDYVKAVRYGLRDWSEFYDAEGKEIPFSPLAINQVPPLLLREVAERIVNDSQLGDDQLKNS